ncbi:MAG: metallophosphoesterase family protein [Arenicella sp.]
MSSRRHFLKRASLIGLTGFVGYSVYRGFRYPPLMFVLDEYPYRSELDGLNVNLQDAMYLKPANTGALRMRATAPEPKVFLRSADARTVLLSVNNVHPKASVLVEGGEIADHSIEKTNHFIQVKIPKENTVKLSWQFPDPEQYRFAVIGDTGGGTELQWCLERSAQLQADFMLHLGDFVYVDGDYQKAVENFQDSEIPCYVTIGNHDFHNNGKIYHTFLEEIGVFNNIFQLGDVQFLNMDSANDFFPPWAGQRGALIQKLIERRESGQSTATETVAFTHRPLADFRIGEDHDINGVHEAQWLTEKLFQAGVGHFFAGHVHDNHSMDYRGIQQVIAGQGLGHKDLLAGKQISEILLVDAVKGQELHYDWQQLAMPWDHHCSTVYQHYKEKDTMLERLREIEKLCSA